MQPKAAFKASLFVQEIAAGTRRLWQSVIVAHKGSRCLSKGTRKCLKPRDAFKRRASECVLCFALSPGDEGMQSAAVIACSSCAPFPCQSLSAGYIKMKNVRKQGVFIFAFKSPDSKSSGLDEPIRAQISTTRLAGVTEQERNPVHTSFSLLLQQVSVICWQMNLQSHQEGQTEERLKPKTTRSMCGQWNKAAVLLGPACVCCSRQGCSGLELSLCQSLLSLVQFQVFG